MNLRLKKIFIASALLIGLLNITSTHASGVFAGTTIQLENLFQGSIFPGSLVDFTVPLSGTTQFDWLGNRGAPVIVNFTDTGLNTAIVTITETFPTAGNYAPSPNVALFTAITPSIPAFTNVTLDASTTAAWYLPSLVQYTSTTFGYDFGGLPIISGGFIQLDITTVNPVSSVPEPSDIWLFGIGILGLLGFKRSKQ